MRGRRSARARPALRRRARAVARSSHLALSLWPAELPDRRPRTTPLTATITELPPPPVPPSAPRGAASRSRSAHAARHAAAPAARCRAGGAPVRRSRRSAAPSRRRGAGRPRPRRRPTSRRSRRAARRRRTDEDAAAARRPRLQGVPRHAGLPDRRGGLSLRARGQSLPHRHHRRGARARRARSARPGQARKPRPHHRRRACSRTSSRVERGSTRSRARPRVFDWEAGIVTLHDDKTAPLEPADVRSAVAHVAVLLHAADVDSRQTVSVATHAPRRPLHDHARGDRDDRVGARRRSTPSAGIAAATTARPTPTSGSRRRCATSR